VTSEKEKLSKYALAIPVLFGVAREDITPDFGEPRGGGTRSHEGQDIVAPKGMLVVSPVRATVESFGTEPTAGKYVYTRGSDGRTYVYIHLDQIAKLKRGQKLKVGDVIGTVGDTGNAQGTTAHLHFEVHNSKGKPIDPYPFLTKEFSLKEKISFLNKGLAKLKNDDLTVTLMATQFRPLLERGVKEKLTLNTRLKKALRTHAPPALSSVTDTLEIGSTGDEVTALQHVLVVSHAGPEAERLSRTGATGYFGTVTRAALREYQRAYNLIESGVYDAPTRAHMRAQATE